MRHFRFSKFTPLLPILLLYLCLPTSISQPPNGGSPPACLFDCMANLTSSTSCEAGDFPCYCNSPRNLSLLQSCISANCTTADTDSNNGNSRFGGGPPPQFILQTICQNILSPTTIITASTSSASSNTPSSTLSSSTTPPTPSITRAEDEPIGPLPHPSKGLAPILGGTIGGVFILVMIITLSVHRIRKRRRKQRATERLAAIQARNSMVPGIEVEDVDGNVRRGSIIGGIEEGNHLGGTGVHWAPGVLDLSAHEEQKRNFVVRFILDGRRRSRLLSAGSRWGDS